MATETMHELVNRVLEHHGTRLYLLQDSDGRLLDVPALRLLPQEADRRNRNLSACGIDYRYCIVGPK